MINDFLIMLVLALVVVTTTYILVDILMTIAILILGEGGKKRGLLCRNCKKQCGEKGKHSKVTSRNV